MDKSLYKLIQDNETNDSFRLSVEFREQDFDLTVFKKSNAWAAKVEYQNICFQAEQLEIDIDEYVRKLKEYLKNTPTTAKLKFNTNEFIVNCILENNMKVIYFSCRLEKVNYSDAIETLTEKFYTQMNTSLQRLVTIDKDNKDLEKGKNHLEYKLNEFIERKKTDDEELFSNFVLVLNEKKRKIQHLTELLEAFRRGRSSLNPPVEVKKRSKKVQLTTQVKDEKKEIISESEPGDDYDTDEEKSKRSENCSDRNVVNEINQDKNEAYAIPSTSKFNLFADDSPPRHLPKRIKSEHSVDNNSCIKPSTSKQSLENERQNAKLDNKIEDNSPNVIFSTQELLDNI